MMAALTAAQTPGRRVILLERQQRVGRKLLATGNGRCNLSNENALPPAYQGDNPRFAVPALTAFTPEDTLRFFGELGLLTVTEPGGRVYPLSDSSNSVLDVLRLALERAGVELRCGGPVEKILRRGRGFLLSGTESGEVTADAVILACGGAAGSKLGGCSDGYKLAKMLGHHRTVLYPSLTRIRTAPEYPRALKGIRVQAEMTLRREGTKLSGMAGEALQTVKGEVQFTETGVSGPAGFDLSRAGERPLLIGGGMGFTPLYYLAKSLPVKPRVLLGFQSAADVVCADEFKRLGAELTVVTEDGFFGEEGLVSDFLPGLEASYFYACGPEAMLRAVCEQAPCDGEFSLEARMGCGFGACMGCSIETVNGPKRVCRDGPVFRKGELLW